MQVHSVTVAQNLLVLLQTLSSSMEYFFSVYIQTVTYYPSHLENGSEQSVQNSLVQLYVHKPCTEFICITNMKNSVQNNGYLK